MWAATEQRDVVVDFVRARRAASGEPPFDPQLLRRIAGKVQRALELRRCMAWEDGEKGMSADDKSLLDDLTANYDSTLRGPASFICSAASTRSSAAGVE